LRLEFNFNGGSPSSGSMMPRFSLSILYLSLLT
jgi:hypothetical protein